jgi:hypothetical protein
MQKVFQVFVSSTVADLAHERRRVSEWLAKAGHIPAGMEMFPATDQKQFDYIKRIIDRSDYYVVIVGGRYGTSADDKLSYTEKEYDYALERGIPVLAFLHGDPDRIPVGKTDKSASKAKRLEAFRKRLSQGRMVNFWTDPQDLCTMVTVAVGNEINLSPGVGWVRGDQAIEPKMLQEMERLRTENEDLRTRLVQFDGPFVYGGFGRRNIVPKDGYSFPAPGEIQAQVTMANYGKAPAFVTFIEVGKGNLDEGVPATPAYSERFDILDFFFPEMKMGDVRPTRAQIRIPGDGRHFVFQRVWYTDLTGKQHFSGSIYRLEIVQVGDSHRVVDETIMPGSAYWDWDKA